MNHSSVVLVARAVDSGDPVAAVYTPHSISHNIPAGTARILFP